MCVFQASSVWVLLSIVCSAGASSAAASALVAPSVRRLFICICGIRSVFAVTMCLLASTLVDKGVVWKADFNCSMLGVAAAAAVCKFI